MKPKKSIFAALAALSALAVGLTATLPCVAQQAPVISIQPASQTVLAGTNVQFTVAATGHKPLSYQWRFNNSPISGATNTTLVLGDVGANDAGPYSVVVSNSVASITSATAVLTVVFPPVITQQPAASTNVVGSNVFFTVVATGTPPLAYQWLFNGTPISGANSPDLQLNNLRTNQCGAYSVIVTNLYGSVASAEAELTLMVRPALISTRPCPTTALAGQPLTFQFQVCGSSPLDVAVRVNGVRVQGATTNEAVGIVVVSNLSCFPPVVCFAARADFSLLGLGPGVYFVDVMASNPVGVATSPLAAIEYLADIPPSPLPNASPAASAGLIPCFPSYILSRGTPGTFPVTTSAGCNSRINSSCGVITNSSWYRFTSMEAGLGLITTEGSTDDTIVAVLQGSLIDCTNMTVVKCNDDINVARKQSRLLFPVQPTNTYYVVVGGVHSGGTNRLTYGYAPDFALSRFAPDGSFEIQSTVAPLLSYQVQASANLRSNSWFTVFSTNLLATNSLIYFRDTSAASAGTRFYRIAPAP